MANNYTRATFTPVLSTTPAYSGGDILFTTMPVYGAIRHPGGQAIIRGITLHDKDDIGAGITLYFMRSNVSMGTINAAPTMASADVDKIVSSLVIETTDYKDLGGVQVAFKGDLGVPIQSLVDTRTIYVAAVIDSTNKTYTASGIVIDLWLEDEL
jgi:hypothetical protein